MFTSKFSRHEGFQQHRSLFQHSLFFTLKESSSDLRARRREGSGLRRPNLSDGFWEEISSCCPPSAQTWKSWSSRVRQSEPRLRNAALWRKSAFARRKWFTAAAAETWSCSCSELNPETEWRRGPRCGTAAEPTWQSIYRKRLKIHRDVLKNEGKECKYMLKVGLELLFKVYMAPKSCF